MTGCWFSNPRSFHASCLVGLAKSLASCESPSWELVRWGRERLYESQKSVLFPGGETAGSMSSDTFDYWKRNCSYQWAKLGSVISLRHILSWVCIEGKCYRLTDVLRGLLVSCMLLRSTMATEFVSMCCNSSRLCLACNGTIANPQRKVRTTNC